MIARFSCTLAARDVGQLDCGCTPLSAASSLQKIAALEAPRVGSAAPWQF